ncbi:MAG: cytosine permease [Pseudolysinimonas sp.]
MTDVPADTGSSGPDPVEPSEPPLVRRSNYSPPPPDAEPPSFDDDALAEAMAAEVRPYTQPITLPRPPATVPAPPVVSWDGVPQAADAAPAGLPPADAAPASPPGGVPGGQPTEDELLRSLGGASTLEAIERLEKELRLLASGEVPTIDVSKIQPAPQTADQAAVQEAAPQEAAPQESAPHEEAPQEDNPREADPDEEAPHEEAPRETDAAPEPALDHPAPGHFFPAAFQPIAPTAMVPPDAAIGADALAWLAPAGSAADESQAEEPRVAPPTDVQPPDVQPPDVQPTQPALPEVDESLIDPVAAAELNSPAPAPRDPWVPDEAPDSVWDIPTPAPTAPSAVATPTPISTEPPVGPEAPDWLAAPPPSYEPPELVQPPAFTAPAADAAPNVPVDTAPNVPVDTGPIDVSPIDVETMSQLPKPLPTDQPKPEDRAELPPPPGYEDIPIMWGDVASAPAPVAPNLIFPPAPAPLPLFDTPAPATATPADGVPAVPAATEMSSLDHDEDDVIDEVDRVSGTGAIPISSAGTVEPLSPPSEPIATIRLSEGEPALVAKKAQQPAAFDVESGGPEPTALDLRAGRAARLFWLWFAANSSVLSLGLGAVLLGTGMSLRQAIVSTLAGVAISFLPLGLGTLAGKWSGQPTMIVSRATFGHAGNILPALLAVATRVLWGGVLLWLLASAVAQVLVGAGLDAGLGTTVWQLVGLVGGFVIATLIAVFGYGLVAKLQLVVSIVSGLLIVGAAVLTYQHLNFTTALTVPDGSWILVISGATLVFSVVGLAWVHSSSDLARYQRPASYGGSSMLWATFGATLPPFALIAWGAMLAASDPKLAKGLTSNPLAAIAGLLPAWYPAPLLAAAALGLLSGAVLTMYSGGFALQALGVRARRSLTTFVSAILVLATGAALVFVVTDFGSLLRDLVITVAVPVAAWAGIFASEMMIRTRRFHAASLLAPGGLYPQVRWLNFLALIVISGVGLGLVTSSIPGLGWEGFIYGLVGIGPKDLWASSDAGVFVALLLGILVPLIGGVPAIRRQERSPLPQ